MKKINHYKLTDKLYNMMQAYFLTMLEYNIIVNFKRLNKKL